MIKVTSATVLGHFRNHDKNYKSKTETSKQTIIFLDTCWLYQRQDLEANDTFSFSLALTGGLRAANASSSWLR